ncbi:MAG: hypothetical protein ACRC6X_01855 [Culicoidibacterales bacterium]
MHSLFYTSKVELEQEDWEHVKNYLAIIKSKATQQFYYEIQIELIK